MSEIIIDPVTGKKTVIFDNEHKYGLDEPCQICEGLSIEDLLKKKELTYSEYSNGKLVAASFPFDRPPFKLENEHGTRPVHNIYDIQEMYGVSERLIVFGDPDDILSSKRMLKIYQSRDQSLAGNEKIRYVSIFKEYKKDKSSKTHIHSVLHAMSCVPSAVQDNLKGAEERYHSTTRCIYCDIAREEICNSKEFIISKNDDFMAYVPHESKVPYEVRILPLPKNHCEDFGKTSDSKISSLAEILHPILKLFRNMCDDNNKKFELYLYDSPKNSDSDIHPKMPESWHWHFGISSNINEVFYKGIGVYVKTKSREAIAKEFREILQAA